MKIALVTGSSYGMGEDIARMLLDRGYKVYGVSRSRGDIINANYIWLECDLRKPEDIGRIAACIGEKKIDVFVSNAGVIRLENASKASIDSYNFTFNVNVLAPILLVNRLRDKLGHSVIISISSVADRLPESDYALYASSKAANTLYFNSLAMELTKAKIVTLLPDYVNTPMLHSTSDTDTTFDWSATIQSPDIAELCEKIITQKLTVESGANIIIVTEKLKEDLEDQEILYGYNTDSKKLKRLD